MNTPYRSAAVREEGLRPLEPEDEMRLLLERGSRPTGIRQWFGLALSTLLGLAGLVAVAFVGSGKGIFGAVYGLLPAIGTLVAWLQYRRHLRAFREKGYDVTPVTDAPLLFPDEPRMRVAIEPPDPQPEVFSEEDAVTETRERRHS